MELTYKDDIIDRLSEKYNMPYKEVAELVNNNISYIHKLTKTPGVITIKLGFLGNFVFTPTIMGKRIANNKVYSRDVEMLKEKEDIIVKLHKNIKDLVHYRRTFFRQTKRFFFKNYKKRLNTSRGEVYKKIEETQNKTVDTF